MGHQQTIEAGAEVGRSSNARLRSWDLLLRTIGSHTSKVRDLDSRRLGLWEAREQLDEGLVQATRLMGSGCVQEGKGR